MYISFFVNILIARPLHIYKIILSIGLNNYTASVSTTEQCLQEDGKPLFGSLTSRREDCVAALVRFSAVCSQVIQQEMVRKLCIRLLSSKCCSETSFLYYFVQIKIYIYVGKYEPVICWSGTQYGFER
jgi:hypothetical protein